MASFPEKTPLAASSLPSGTPGGAESLGVMPFSAPLLGFCRLGRLDRGGQLRTNYTAVCWYVCCKKDGLRKRADGGTRTPDSCLTMEVLYQLS